MASVAEMQKKKNGRGKVNPNFPCLVHGCLKRRHPNRARCREHQRIEQNKHNDRRDLKLGRVKKPPHLRHSNKPWSEVTENESKTIRELCSGIEQKEVAVILGVSKLTVFMRVKKLRDRLGVKTMFQLGMWAQANGYGLKWKVASISELPVLRYLADGLDQKRTAQQLGIHKNAVFARIRRLRRRLGCKNCFQLGMWAQANGYASKKAWKYETESCNCGNHKCTGLLCA